MLNGFLYHTPREGQLGVKKSGDTREMRLSKEVRQKVGNLEPAAQGLGFPLLPPPGGGLLTRVRSATTSSSNW